MTTGRSWALFIAAIAVAALGNAASAHWANQANKLSVWLLVVVLLAPLVFISFGLVAARTGLAVAAGTVDLSLTLVTFVVGLVAFREWGRVSPAQYAGMALAVAGIGLMLFFPKHPA